MSRKLAIDKFLANLVTTDSAEKWYRFNDNFFTKFLLFFLLLHSLESYSQVDFISSNLPIIIIQTNGQDIIDDPRIIASMSIINNTHKRNYLTDSINGYDGRISIEIRGSTSNVWEKKQYGFETQQSDGSNFNTQLLGLPAENDWVLNGPYSDKSLMRNVLAYKLSENLGNYAPRTRFCELVINNEYLGLYVLIEKIKRDKNRVNIAKLKPDEISGDDLTGGYIIKFDKGTGQSCGVIVTEFANIFTQIEYPDCDSIVDEQKEYIENYINSFEASLYSESFSDSLIGYRNFINVNSFVDYFIINEISKNIDAYNISSFLYKDKDSKQGKLTFGPVWDYNIAFGNANYRDGYTINGLQASSHIWYNRLLQDSIFTNLLEKRWVELRNNHLSNNNILKIIDSISFLLDEAQERNFQRWNILSTRLWPNFYVGDSYLDETNFLSGWLMARLSWLDNNIIKSRKEYEELINYDEHFFPNPFTYFFTFTFNLEKEANVSLRLLDQSGNWVVDIRNDSYYKVGTHKLVWNSFINRQIIKSGLYVLVFEIDGEIISKEKIIKHL